MNALDALMPMHAALTKPAVQKSGPIKYVIVSKDGNEYPVSFHGAIKHRYMVPQGFTPVSAGFYMVFGGRVVVATGIGSDSLKIGPRPQDREMLQRMIDGL
jgi:hypothetical protein